jgi:hypothetical protein
VPAMRRFDYLMQEYSEPVCALGIKIIVIAH